MTATPITTIPNRPAGQPVFDFQIASGYCRVPLSKVSQDANNLIVTGWAYQIDGNGVPVLDSITAAPIATADDTNTIVLSGIMAGTHTLYDGWAKYIPGSQQTLNADNLPAGWTSGSGAPSGTAAYGAGYYDTASGQGWVYTQGMLPAIAQGYANALQAQIDTAAKLAALGL